MNNKVLRLYSLIFLIIFSLSEFLFAQLNPNNLVQFNEKDGLPGAEIGQVLQDHLGYIWIPSLSGLTRYNGYEFKRYLMNLHDSTSIKTTIIGSLFEDSKRNIWIGGTACIDVYNPYNKSFKQFENGALREFTQLVDINSISESENGVIYFGVCENTAPAFKNSSPEISNCLLYYDEKDGIIKKFQPPKGIVIRRVYRLRSDFQKNIWILSKSGLFKIDRKNNFTKINAFNEELINNNGIIHDFKIDKNGIIWISGYNSKFFSFDTKTEKTKVYSLNGLFKGFDNKLVTRAIAIDKFNNIWLGSDQGLIFFDRAKKKFDIFQNESGRYIERADIYGLNFDSFGSLWIGTESKGLLKYDERTLFESFSYNKDENSSLTSGWANRIIEGKNGKIWITTSDDNLNNFGLNEFDPKTRKIKRWFIKNSLPACHALYGIYQLSKNQFYLGTDLGLFLFNSNNNSIKKIIFNGLSKNSFIYDFYNDTKGNLWLCTNIGIYKRNKGGEKFTHYYLVSYDSLRSVSNQVTRVIESKHYGLWFCTDNGLFLYNYDKDKFERRGFDIKSGSVFPCQDINSLYEDKNGIVWIGEWEGGLSRYNPLTGEIKNYSTNDGLPSMNIQGILGDEKNNTLWLSTFEGLVRFDKSTKQFTNYTTEDGIQSQLFADGSYLKTSNGLFIFGGSNGITVFNPNDIVRNSIPPKVFLTDLKISNKSILPGKNSILKKPIYDTDEITLNHNDNNISIDFIALHYLNPSKNQYAYILENYEKDWRSVGNQRSAYYSNLPPGEYMFRVKASNNHDLWNVKGAELKIIIKPPWWETWWAYLTYAAFTLFALYLIRRYEMNRISYKNQIKINEAVLKEKEETEKIKSQFFANISHEFRTPLTLILGPAEKIITSSTKDIKKEAGIIKTNSLRLLHLVNQLLDLSKLESEKLKLKASKQNIVSFIKWIALSFESLSESKDITLQLITEQEYIELYFDKEKMTKIFTNILSNAFKFTPEEGKITITIKEISLSKQDLSNQVWNNKGNSAKNFVEIKIRDTGIGIPQSEITKLFDRFYQVDSSLTREHEGTGIGLALTKELVELHRGRIIVNSELGKWAEFTVNLPLGFDHLKQDEIFTEEIGEHEIVKLVMDEESIKISDDIENEIAEKNNGASKDIILVVEDNYDMRKYIKNSLSNSYLVEEAINGEQGLRKAEKIIPDLIISDIMMPKMDGNELTKKLKNDERTSHIPIIILTAKTGQDNKLEGLKTGADDYLIKPFDTQELIVRIENLIKIRKNLQVKYGKGEPVHLHGDKKLRKIDEQFLTKVLGIIENHISDESFSIEDFSYEIGMSRTQLHRKLKAIAGKSASQYLRTVRLARAKKLIEEENGNISEIAYSVGFSSPAYFTKCFKEEFGYPPSEIKFLK